MFHVCILEGNFCAILCYQQKFHKLVVQLEVLTDQDDYFTSNIDLGTGPDQAIHILGHNIPLGLNFLEEICWLCWTWIGWVYMTKCKPIMLCMFFLKSKGLVDCVHNFLTKSLSCTYPPNEGTQITSHGYGRKIKAYTKVVFANILM
jgi:hypothetical protein